MNKDRQKLIEVLEWFYNKAGVRTERFAHDFYQKWDMSQSQARKIVYGLEAAGMLERSGDNKAAHYFLSDLGLEVLVAIKEKA